MKKYLLIVICLVQVVFLPASNRYWVGGTGNWNSASHWSESNGGAGGAMIPTADDDVIFNQNSFSANKQTVMVTANAVCHSIDWSAIDDNAVFSASPSTSLTVFGSYKLSPLLWNGFKGNTIFAATSAGNTISTAHNFIVGDYIFNGTGSWLLQDDITTDNTTSIRLLQGSLNTDGKKVNCGSFIGNSHLTRNLSLSNSEITIKNTWDFSTSSNLIFDGDSSTLIFTDSINTSNFKDGNLRYGFVSTIMSLGTRASSCVFPGAFTVTLTADSVTCNGLNNGSACAVITGGSGTFLYDWNFAATPAGDGTLCITGLGSSTNTIKVTDVVTGIVRFCSISVGEPSLLFDYETFTNIPTCFGLCNAMSSVQVTGGTAPYTISWSGGLGTNDTATNICAGTYTVTVTDSKGCKDSSAVIVIGQPLLLVSPGSVTNVSCFGLCDGTASIAAAGGTAPYVYDWTLGSPVGDGTDSISMLCAGTYTCTTTDSHGCTSTYNAVITQPPVLTLTLAHTDASCLSVCDGTATATVSGGTPPYSYSWSNGTVVSTASTTNSVSSLCAGSITIIVTDAKGCTQTVTQIITEPVVLVATASGTNVTCFGACNGTATVSVTGGTPTYTYSWVGPAGYTATTASISSLCPGVYTVTVTDSHLCTAVSAITITQPPLLLANAVGTNITTCYGACIGSATSTPTGGTPPYTYSWSTGATTPTISSLCAGVYTVTVTDFKGCTSVQSVTITQPTDINAGLSFTNVTCNGACNGTATSAPSGGTPGYTFSWSTGATTATISGLCPGTYTVTVTDLNGCTKVGSVTITQPNILTVAVTSTALSCYGDCNATASATIAGGTPPYTIDWLPGAPVGDGSTTISSLCAGTYTVNITDFKGCTATATITITQPPLLLANAVGTNITTCYGACIGSATSTPTGGTPPYTYSWSTGATTPTISSLCAGVYTVTVTDFKGCTSVQSVTITQPTDINAGLSFTNVTCNGACNGTATSAPSGGTPGYTFSWSTGATTATISGLCPGTYTVTVTDLNGCTKVGSVTITQPNILTVAVTSTALSCYGDCNATASATIAGGTPPYTIDWLPGAPVGDGSTTISSLCAGTYTVNITDFKGCTATQTVTITNPVALTISTVSTSASCNTIPDGAIDVTVGGGTLPYAYQWSGGSAATIEDLAAILSGSYTITVTDSNSCTIADTILLPANAIVIAVAGNDTSFCQSESLTLSAASSVNGVNYQWFEMPGNTSVGNTDSVSVNPPTGLTSYYVTVDNGSGCSDNDTVVVASNALPVVSAGPDVILFVGTSSPIGGSPTTTSPGATYQWMPTPGALDNSTVSNPTASPIATATYTVTVTSAQGCTASDSMVVNVRPTIVFPDGISPNGDGANDEWIIDGIELFPDCVVEVYNRWGELLFQSVGYKEHWKGIFKNKPLPVGTYYYVINLKDPIFPDTYTGPITIMR